ncbi:MAG: N-acetylmuramoyl-L-alanine amidase [Polyangiaceae bacterium]|nr:N-acetylmuramoyl-L-alanine amidase [Polyangiaceae bacterium]MCL4753939.1 N-acetylmuramoyl-L-alanine amidase [Myxococcales bacterium]
MDLRLVWLKLPLLVLALLLGACGPSEREAPASARAQLSGDSPLVGHFREAERQSGVPAELLATIAQVQTRLSMNLGAHDEHDADHEHAPREWGLMAIGSGGLTSADAAALLIGVSVELVATDARTNIRAAAALLKTSGHARGVGAGDGLDAWVSVVEAYGGEALVSEVRALLSSGWKGHDDQGFVVEVSGVGLDGDELAAVQQGLGYPGAIWSAAYSGNYTNASRGAAQINYVIIHTTQGSYAGAISWFKNSSSKVSAHYVIRSSDGQITQMVDDADIAWHDACFNSQTIGIEHEGWVADPGKWYTEAMYKSSAKLTRWLCDQYGIPKDKKHIMGHGEAPDCSDHTDPGSGWNWAHYMDLVVNGECTPKTEICNGKDDDCDGKVDEGDVCNAPPKGYLDEVSCEGIKGWAQDPDAATKPIDVHLYFGGPAGSGATGVPLTADVERDDLCTAIGSCNHGFDVYPPLSLFDGQAHPIHAYGIDSAGGANAELTGSPKSLTCTAAASGVRRHVVDPTSFEVWKLDLFWDALPLGDTEIGKLPEASAWPSAPELVQADDGSPEVWLVDGKWRRHVPSPAVMAAWSLSFDAVKQVPAAEVAALWEGPKLRGRPVIVKDTSGKIEMIDDPMPAPGTAVKAPTPEEAGWGGGAGVSGKPTGSAKHESDAGDVGASCAVGQRPPSGSAGWLLLAGALVPLWRRRR